MVFYFVGFIGIGLIVIGGYFLIKMYIRRINSQKGNTESTGQREIESVFEKYMPVKDYSILLKEENVKNI